jgi:hypothetical protein
VRTLAIALLVTGCAGQLTNSLDSDDLDAPDEQERPIGPAHGQEGEQVEYEVKLRGVVVGRFQIAVGTRGVVNGRSAVNVHSRASGAGLADVFGQFSWDLVSTTDIDSGCTLAEDESIDVEIAGKRDHQHDQRTFDLNVCQRDVHAAAGALRGWHSHVGSTTQLDVTFGTKTLDVRLADAGRETIKTVLGNTPAIRYEGSTSMANSYSLVGWISDDVARVPLRMHGTTKLGDIDVELVNYDVPHEP